MVIDPDDLCKITIEKDASIHTLKEYGLLSGMGKVAMKHLKPFTDSHESSELFCSLIDIPKDKWKSIEVLKYQWIPYENKVSPSAIKQ